MKAILARHQQLAVASLSILVIVILLMSTGLVNAQRHSSHSSFSRSGSSSSLHPLVTCQTGTPCPTLGVPPANQIVAENQQPGTPGWQATHVSYTNLGIQGYAREASSERGGTVHLFVSSASTYSISVYRLGYYQDIGARLYQTIANRPALYQGYAVKGNAYPTDCGSCITSLTDALGQETDITAANWQQTDTLVFNASWISGIYYLKLANASGYQWSIPVVVRDDSASADLVLDDPVYTDQTYNEWGGTSGYVDHRHVRGKGPTGYLLFAYYVSYDRPYNRGNGVGNLLQWTYPMLRFLEQSGYNVTYTSDFDISSGVTNLLHYKGVIYPGHAEYMDFGERAHIEAALAAGVSQGFLGANSMYWQVRQTTIAPNTTTSLIIYRDPALDPDAADPNLVQYTTTRWRDAPLNRPEDVLMKAMYGAYEEYNAPLEPMTLVNTASPVFGGLSVQQNEVVAGLVGDEIDTVFDDGSITANDHITVVTQSPFVDYTGKAWTAESVLNEADNTNGAITFDAGWYGWPGEITDFPVSFQSSSGPYLPYSPLLAQMTFNILYRMIHGVWLQYSGTIPGTPISAAASAKAPPPAAAVVAPKKAKRGTRVSPNADND